MSDLDLQGIRERAEAATPGPWEAEASRVTRITAVEEEQAAEEGEAGDDFQERLSALNQGLNLKAEDWR